MRDQNEWKSSKRSAFGRRIRSAVGYVFAGAVLVTGGWLVGEFQNRSDYVYAATPTQSLSTNLTTEKVMAVGGSMAHGWKDPNNDGYLKRAFQALNNSTNTKYVYDDRTQPGGSPTWAEKNNKFQTWLTQDKPQIVVISWGLLNDVFAKTPMDEFSDAIHDEIQESLAAGAVVVFVTSPVTKATATYNHGPVERFIHTEEAEAASFNSPNVYFIELNQDMANYLTAHGQTWQNYYGDSWHPDSAGHELAGELLFDEWIQMFGTSAPTWQSTGGQ